MTYTLRFIAPTRPLSINESNRLHWATRRRRLDPWKELVQLLWTVEHGTQVDGHATIHVTLGFTRGARRDPHNYTSTVIKAIVDGLVRAGAFPDDTAEYLTVIEPVLSIDPGEWCTVEVRV